MIGTFPEVLVGQELLSYRFALSEYHGIGPKKIQQSVEVLVVYLSEATLTIGSLFETESSVPDGDRLHFFVNSKILTASLVEGNALTLVFQDNRTLRVKLDAESYRCPEALCYHPLNGNIIVLK